MTIIYNVQNVQKRTINITNGGNGYFYYVEISFEPISLNHWCYGIQKYYWPIMIHIM